MSLKVNPLPALPADTAQLVLQLFPATNLFRVIGDQLSELGSDADFADLYPAEGRPALSPALLALVLVFQFLEQLGDRQAAAMVVSRLDWKYALHLPLAYAGFDYSVLCEFRQRLLAHDAQARVFERLLQRLDDWGLLGGRRQQRTDSLAVLAAVRGLSRLELTMETMRLAINSLEDHGLDWLRANVPTGWAERYGRWTQHERLVWARGEAGRVETHQRLSQTGADGQWLLDKLRTADAPAALAALPAVAQLRTVWQQQFEATPQGIQPRPKVDTCGAQRLSSPHDPDVRYGEHGGAGWEGYLLYATETADPDWPHLITDVHTTPAGQSDTQWLDAIQTALAERGLLPEQQYVDGGFVSGETLALSQGRGVELLGPVQADTSWQARTPDGLTLDQFQLDQTRRVAICPGGQTSRTWSDSHSVYGDAVVHIQFAAAVCQACPLQPRCWRPSGDHPSCGRTLQLKAHHALVRQRRGEQATPEFRQRYRRRAGIEASLSEMVRGHGVRTARYRGLKKVHLQHLFLATAVNLKRAVAWLSGRRPQSERQPGLRRLAAAT
jgi:transposase